MTTGVHTYKSATSTAFKGAIQEVIQGLTKQAALDGYKQQESNFKFIISQVGTNWVIVLLVFTSEQDDPKQYVETIPVR